MSQVTVDRVQKIFGDVRALDDVSLSVNRGEFLCVVGRTNAGKSTLLKTIAGIHRPNVGRVIIAGNDVTPLPPQRRSVSLLFQNIALFPTKTGRENIAFPLRMAGEEVATIDAKVRAIAKMLKIEHVLERLPRTFSGGEQQRVAIGRAIIRPCDVLMLDEPLTNLDASIRIRLRIEFKKLHRELGQTIIYVTHDQVEALSLSDRVAVLDRGRIQQIGTPDEVYNRPINRFVAEFIGSPPMNIIEAELDESDGRLSLVAHDFTMPLDREEYEPLRQMRLPRQIAFGVHPERVNVAPKQSSATPIGAEVLWVERLGNRSIAALRIGEAVVKAAMPPNNPCETEKRIWVGLRPESHHLLSRQTGIFFRPPG